VTGCRQASFFGCIRGSDHGAMGIHYVNGNLLNGTADATQPQTLIYEPSSNGDLKLVGVEFIVDAKTWLQTHSSPPFRRSSIPARRRPQTATPYRCSSNSTFGRGGILPEKIRLW